MGWRMFRAHLREMNRARDARTDPDSWAGARNDSWWPSNQR